MRTLIVLSALATVLLGTSLPAAAQSGAFCLKSSSGITKCAYQTMAQCEQVKKSGDQCLSRSETTGAASGNSGSSPSQAPAERMAPSSPSR